MILAGVRGRERQPGELRTTQNWLGPPGATIGTAPLVPPPPSETGRSPHRPQAIRPRAAVAAAPGPGPRSLHYQFETIHPFLDGNGRLGRLLIVFFLVGTGIGSQSPSSTCRPTSMHVSQHVLRRSPRCSRTRRRRRVDRVVPRRCPRASGRRRAARRAARRSSRAVSRVGALDQPRCSHAAGRADSGAASPDDPGGWRNISGSPDLPHSKRSGTSRTPASSLLRPRRTPPAAPLARRGGAVRLVRRDMTRTHVDVGGPGVVAGNVR